MILLDLLFVLKKYSGDVKIKINNLKFSNKKLDLETVENVFELTTLLECINDQTLIFDLEIIIFLKNVELKIFNDKKYNYIKVDFATNNDLIKKEIKTPNTLITMQSSIYHFSANSYDMW